MGDGVLHHFRHLCEGEVRAVWLKHRVVAMAVRTARWPYQYALSAALEGFAVAVGPDQAQHRDECATPLRRRYGTGGEQFFVRLGHGDVPAARRSGPIGGVDAG